MHNRSGLMVGSRTPSCKNHDRGDLGGIVKDATGNITIATLTSKGNLPVAITKIDGAWRWS
jgi:hypothetical protein